jgi:hypothetical protein
MSVTPDDYRDNQDWTKGSGPQDLGISNREELKLWLNAHRMTFTQFSRLPVYWMNLPAWRKVILG